MGEQGVGPVVLAEFSLSERESLSRQERSFFKESERAVRSVLPVSFFSCKYDGRSTKYVSDDEDESLCL